MASIRFEGEGHTPAALDKDSRVLSDHCQPSQPSFSTDGRWLNAVVGLTATASRVARVSIVDVLPIESRL